MSMQYSHTDPLYQPPHHNQPRNGLGTAGFVVGLVGLVFAFIPIVGVVAWPMVIVGLVLSIIGVVRVHHGHATNKGLSIAGIAVSAAGLVICVLWLAAFGSAANQVQQNQLHPAGSSQQSAPAATEHTAVFTLSTDTPVNVQYGEFGSRRSDVVQPTKKWTRKFTFSGGHHSLSLYANPVGSDFSSPITCSITVDGHQLAQQSNPVGVWCSATVSK